MRRDSDPRRAENPGPAGIEVSLHLIQTTLTLTFLGVFALAGEILVRTRRRGS